MSTTATKPACVLTIAGSDSGGGAGIQADLKTFVAFGVHGLSAVTALTAQNTRGVVAVTVPSVRFLGDQITACFDDFEISAVKIGMLANARIITRVAMLLRRYRPQHIVLDPVMVASSGARLLEGAALAALRTQLLPLASVLTPNIPEAELLLGRSINSDSDVITAAKQLQAMGARAVLLKGGHLHGRLVTDHLRDGTSSHDFIHPRLKLEGHGTGCTLASAMAANLCLGKSLPDACSIAADYVHGALLHGYRPGKSDLVVLDHFWRLREAPSP